MSNRSHNITSQMDLFQHTSVQLLCLAGPKGSDVNQSSHHHITDGSFSGDFCSDVVCSRMEVRNCVSNDGVSGIVGPTITNLDIPKFVLYRWVFGKEGEQ